MNKSSITLIILVIILIGFLGYYFYSNADSVSGGNFLLQSVNDRRGPLDDPDLAFLEQVKGIRLDVAFFLNPAYISLTDFTVKISDRNVGRPNPFAPVSGIPSPLAGQGNQSQ